MKKKFYTVRQARKAGCTVEPIKCGWCGCTGEVQYNQIVGDFYCAICGRWDNEELN